MVKCIMENRHILEETMVLDEQGRVVYRYFCSCGLPANDCGHWPAPGAESAEEE